MLTHFSSFSFQITAHFSLIFEPIRDQVCLLYLFLRSIHFQILMLLEISMLQVTFSPGYLGEPKKLTGRHLFQRRRVKNVIYARHGVPDGLNIPDIADVEFDFARMIRIPGLQLVAHIVLFFLIPGKDADLTDVSRQKMF